MTLVFQITIKGKEMNLYEAGVKWYEAEDRIKKEARIEEEVWLPKSYPSPRK